MIAIVDYGLGNLKSVLSAFQRIGAEALVTSSGRDVASARAVVLPGVGAFWRAMENLRQRELIDVIRQVARSARPLLGICLGLQLFFEESSEHGRNEGLGIIPGKVTRFAEGLTIPHMGWNELRQVRPCPLFEGIDDRDFFYFAHSYLVQPDDGQVTVGTTDYGGPFVSAVQLGSLFAVQFHPEKSGPSGLRMLTNFAALGQGE